MQKCKYRVVVVSKTRQDFRGTAYYKKGKYFQSKDSRLHRDVWEFFSGEQIPEGFHVHHEDGDRSNNQYENLILVEKSEHLELHCWLRTKDMSPEERNEMVVVARGSAKEWHQSKEGRDWHRRAYEAFSKDALHKLVERVCEQCGKEFTGRPQQRFCSNKCKSKWRRVNGLDNETRKCVVCGREFAVNKYSKQVTCGRACGAKHSGEIRRGRPQPKRKK